MITCSVCVHTIAQYFFSYYTGGVVGPTYFDGQFRRTGQTSTWLTATCVDSVSVSLELIGHNNVAFTPPSGHAIAITKGVYEVYELRYVRCACWACVKFVVLHVPFNRFQNAIRIVVTLCWGN